MHYRPLLDRSVNQELGILGIKKKSAVLNPFLSQLSTVGHRCETVPFQAGFLQWNESSASSCPGHKPGILTVHAEQIPFFCSGHTIPLGACLLAVVFY